MKEYLQKLLDQKSVAIAGFGREGQATYKLIRKYFPDFELTLLDNNQDITQLKTLQQDKSLKFVLGPDCFQSIDNYDIVIKSPGIPTHSWPAKFDKVHITSQTDLFLGAYHQQVIGITGTKGKSTTSSLIYHILKNSGKDTLLVGNIGIPPFEHLEEIREHTRIVMELSSHQLEFLSYSPHIAVLLNIYQEHLDHYSSYGAYQKAKLNIVRFQTDDDYFIYNADNKLLNNLVTEDESILSKHYAFSLLNTNTSVFYSNKHVYFNDAGTAIMLYDGSAGQPLQGEHNMYNIMTAAVACYLTGLSAEEITASVRTFQGLEHRLEFVGEYSGIQWYNDSISTIPEAAIEAVKTLKKVDTLILGGFDRGIDYTSLYHFLSISEIKNLILVGEAGKRMYDEMSNLGKGNLTVYKIADYSEVITLAAEITSKGKICLLSPAAASYDMFKNFEERGHFFKNKVRALRPSHI